MRAFHFSGGDVLWSRHVLDAADIEHFNGLFEDEARAAFNAGDLAAEARALGLATELALARTEQARWQRATGGMREIVA